MMLGFVDGVEVVENLRVRQIQAVADSKFVLAVRH